MLLEFFPRKRVIPPVHSKRPPPVCFSRASGDPVLTAIDFENGEFFPRKRVIRVQAQGLTVGTFFPRKRE